MKSKTKMATSSSKIKPIGDRVAVEVEMSATVSPSGLAIAVTPEMTNFGLVIAAGEDAKGVSAGDRVLFDKYSGTEVQIDDKKYLMLKIANIVAVVE